MSVGYRITKLRKSKNLTQENFAKQVGISRAALSHYEKNRREPDYETLIKIADYCDVTTDYLIRGEDYRSEAQKILDDPDTQIAARDGDPDAEETLRLIQEILEKQKKEK